MEIRKISADYIHPVSGDPIKNGVVVIDGKGTILEIGVKSDYDEVSVEYYKGHIVPGFVNTHCHLELSHMKGKVDTGTKLIPFITDVVTKRNVDEELIASAIEEADEYMYNAGIVAVGDISNTTDTFEVKRNSKIKYHTFVEFFDFLQNENSSVEFQKYKAVYDALELKAGDKKTCVPHAPYSVSEGLFKSILETHDGDVTVSIHNQETPPENELFEKGTGDFVDFYNSFGVDLAGFESIGKGSIFYALSQLNAASKTLFVHNTLTTESEVAAAQQWSDKVYWAICANANLYIENRLPFYKNFLNQNAKMTIGTDSLTSNWKLSVFDEM